jgi:hypothetical protein
VRRGRLGQRRDRASDGTKMAANAAMEANRTLTQIDDEVARILAEAEATDAAEDDPFGDGRGEELPADLADPRSRAARLAEAKRRLAERADERERSFQDRSKLLNDARAAKGLAPRTYRPRARDEAPQPEARTNVTDPDSRLMRAPGGSVQGYNGQIVCTPEQVIVAAELTTDINDVLQLEPMLDAAGDSLDQAGVAERPDALVADAGYWRAENIDGDNGIELFIPVPSTAGPARPARTAAPRSREPITCAERWTPNSPDPKGRPCCACDPPPSSRSSDSSKKLEEPGAS